MQDVRVTLRNLTAEVKAMLAKEREIKLASTELIGQLDLRNAAVNLGMTTEAFANHIGLTIHQYWRRTQAARILKRFPTTLEMVRAGEISLSHVALLYAKITEANQKVILEGIKNKSKREVEFFLSTVTMDGRRIEAEPTIEVRLKLTKSDVEKLDRAREVLSHSGQVPDLTAIVVKALDDLIDKRDPQKKAERAAARQEKRAATAPGQSTATQASEQVASEKRKPEGGRDVGTEGTAPVQSRRSKTRPAVPKAIEHAIRMRDGGQCSWIFPDGSRCPERGALELDHVETMWCRGGKHTVDGMALRCRHHNRVAAERELGPGYLVTWAKWGALRNPDGSGATQPTARTKTA